jgi:Na+/melibiose symporter-like transporter
MALKKSLKLYYGLGQAAQGIKDGAFQLFLFFFYSQVLGLSPSLAGLAALLALVVDAVTDPLVGAISDASHSRWGRRHPFMVLSAVPFGLLFFLLFSPPDALSQWGLFAWFLGFSIAVRVALTFFFVPHMSLGAEMTTDYVERTSIVSYRVMIGTVAGPIAVFISLNTFFSASEGFSNGMLNAAAYPSFGMFCALLSVLTMLLCAWGTRSVIAASPKTAAGLASANPFQGLIEIGHALRLKSFRILLASGVMTYTALGVGSTLTVYLTTYFFEFSPAELAFLPVSIVIGGLMSVPLSPWATARFDKRLAAVFSGVSFGLMFSLPYTGRLLGLLPENGSALLLPLVVVINFFAYTCLYTNFAVAGSMMADVADEYELATGKRQEGVFFSSQSFAFKATFGFGTFFAGLGLDLIDFPRQAAVSDIPAQAIFGLGVFAGPVICLIQLLAVSILLFYPISAAQYQRIRTSLEQRIEPA